MFEKHHYTLRGIADELNVGESTIQYLADQYHGWIPFKAGEKHAWYPREAVEVLRFIVERSNSGVMDQDLETELSGRYPLAGEPGKQEAAVHHNQGEIQTSSGGDTVFGVLQGLLEGLSGQQMRIADAQERRAAAEERKAMAMEKRADAQRMMAEALNNLAAAMQGMPVPMKAEKESATSGQALSEADRAFLPELLEATRETVAADSDDIERQAEVLDALLHDVSAGDDASVGAGELDDLADLLDDSPDISASEMDDLSELLEDAEAEASDDNIQARTQSEAVEAAGNGSVPDLEDRPDLSGGQPEDRHEQAAADLDDLSELLDGPSEPAESELLDDLDALIQSSPEPDSLTGSADRTPEEGPDGLDDLSELLDDADQTAGPPELDDLAELLDEDPDAEAPDEGRAVQTAETAPAEPLPEAEPTAEGPAAGPPDQAPSEQKPKIPGDYKSKIIALIIQLKEKKGMGIEAVTEYMNAKGYKTISGKGQWTAKTISQIFDHIRQIRTAGG